MRKEIYYSGFTFTLNPPYGIDLKISKLGFLTIGVPDVFYTRITENECEYKHKEFEYDIFKAPTPALKIAEEQKKKTKDNFFMKPFEGKGTWEALTNDNLVYCYSNSFIEDIKKKNKLPRIFNKFLLFSLIAIIFSLWLYVFFGIFVLTLFFLFIREIANYDDRRIISVIFYDIDKKTEDTFNILRKAFQNFRKIDFITNSKRNGKNNVTHEPITVTDNYKELIRTNIDIFIIKVKEGHILFFPDKIIVFYKDGKITGYNYRNLNIKSGKVKQKNGSISFYLSIKDINDFHLLFYINDENTAQSISKSLIALQNKKNKSK